MSQFAKFRGSLWQNCPNFAASRLCINYLYFLSEKLLGAGMALSYASNMQKKLLIFFLFKSATCQLVV